MNLKSKTVLATGGSGFIGSHVVEELLRQEANVIIYDTDISQAERLFSNNPKVEIVNGNILDKIKFEKYIEKSDMVIHLAAMLGVERTEKFPLEVLRNDLEGTINCLELSAKHNIERFVFISSCEVFGNPKHSPLAEDDLKAPNSIYGLAKLTSEKYCHAYHANGLHTVVARVSNTYGPRQRPEWVVSIFFNNVLNNKPITIFGDGEQQRSFCYVVDTAEAIVKALDAPSGEVINIGGGLDNVVTVKELANKIIKVTGKDVPVVHREFGNGIRTEAREAKIRHFAVEKAEKILGWSSTMKLEDGLRKTWEWYGK